MMKAGIIDIFADAFGWVLAKTAVFALAVLAGIAIGGLGLWAGSEAAGGFFGFKDGSHPVFKQLRWVTALLPQIIVVFWAGMVFVRSEQAEMKHWLQVVALEAGVMAWFLSGALPDGWLAVTVTWITTLAGVAALVWAGRRLERRHLRRGLEHLARLEEENRLRRAWMKETYGTESVSARELGIL